MKKNRSNKFTIGLCNTFEGLLNLRVLFFELDKEHLTHYIRINELFESENLDYVSHRTGSGGIHFLSPTMITKDHWKSIMAKIKKVNPTCPMTTLRMKPNKYEDEELIYYVKFAEFYGKNNFNLNSKEMCIYLNRLFNTNFEGNIETKLKIVHYPLPKTELIQ